jgi:ubiquinone/menaquinone biosynthesis C-methylase UbiE
MKKAEVIWRQEVYYDHAHAASAEILTHPGFREMKRNIRSRDTVLDVGCGEGTKIAQLAGNRKGVYGIDISRTGIARAKKQYPSIDFRTADSEELPYADNFFDVVLTCFVLEHVDNAEKVLSEIMRVTKPGGKIMLICPNFASPFFRSPCYKKSLAHRHLAAWKRAARYLVRKPSELEWEKVEPITDQPFQSDFDCTIEPSLFTTCVYLEKHGFTTLQAASHWHVFQPKRPMDYLYMPPKALGILGVYPFHWWGPELFIIAQKPR